MRTRRRRRPRWDATRPRRPVNRQPPECQRCPRRPGWAWHRHSPALTLPARGSEGRRRSRPRRAGVRHRPGSSEPAGDRLDTGLGCAPGRTVRMPRVKSRVEQDADAGHEAVSRRPRDFAVSQLDAQPLIAVARSAPRPTRPGLPIERALTMMASSEREVRGSGRCAGPAEPVAVLPWLDCGGQRLLRQPDGFEGLARAQVRPELHDSPTAHPRYRVEGKLASESRQESDPTGPSTPTSTLLRRPSRGGQRQPKKGLSPNAVTAPPHRIHVSVSQTDRDPFAGPRSTITSF